MPRGVYDRSKSKKGTAGTQASGAGHTASKAKKSWKKTTTAGISAGGSNIGSDRFSALEGITKYADALARLKSALGSSTPELEQEIKATLSTMRNVRETTFNVDTDQVLSSGGDQQRQTASAVAAPVPFNPPSQFPGAVQQ